MFEVLIGLLASFVEVILTIVEPLGEIILAVFSFDKSLGGNSRLGESPLAKEGRRDWRNCGCGCLVLVVLAIGSGVAWKLWS